MSNQNPLRWLTGSIPFRVATLGFLSLLLLIPLASVRDLIRERKSLRSEAASSIVSGWGNAQTILGPALVLQADCGVADEKGKIVSHSRQVAVQLPADLRISTRTTSEVRRRGIHAIPLYRARVRFEFEIDPPPFAHLDWDCDRTTVEAASVALSLSDARGIDRITPLEAEGLRESWVAGTPLGGPWSSGVQVPISPARLYPAEKPILARFELEVRGSDRLWIAPAGSPTKVEMASDWPTPSFDGAFLPSERAVRADGYDAVWQISELARPVRSLTLDGAGPELASSAFGVTWFQAADQYLMTERSLKYGFLFVVLTFLTFFLFELTGMRRAHFLQYGLVGGALCVFYLLLLSISEHLTFDAAYFVAAAATATQITLYGRAFLASPRRTTVLAMVLVALYASLYFLVGLEEMALLLGSIGLFLVIAITMWLTREVNREPATGVATAEN